MSREAYDQEIEQLLDGAVDTHVHTGPDVFARHDTDFEAARKARDRGMDAILVKSHHFETGSRGQLATQETGFRVLGGVSLNKWVGGYNPDAVEGAANLGSSVVWLPTITATNHMERGLVPHLDKETPRDAEKEGVATVDDEGNLRPEAVAVAERIAETGIVVALGHLSPSEAITFTETAVDVGVEKILCIHPHAKFLDYSHDELQTLVDMGVTVELHYAMTTEMMDYAATIDDFIAAIEAVGVENVILATDGGSLLNPPAIEMFESFVRDMLEAGVPSEDISTMIETNPKRLYEIDG